MAIAIIAMAQFGIREMAHMAPRYGTGAKVPPQISPARAQHILYGDSHGGGHLHGQNSPCKSEFPAGWTGPMILAIVMRDAANDNLDWRHEGNGNDIAEVMEDGVKIRIVVNARHDEVITAYPVNTPRNPCPAANGDGD
jgi:hypothetical protein